MATPSPSPRLFGANQAAVLNALGETNPKASAEQALARLQQRFATAAAAAGDSAAAEKQLAQQLRRLLQIPRWQDVLVAPLADEVRIVEGREGGPEQAKRARARQCNACAERRAVSVVICGVTLLLHASL